MSGNVGRVADALVDVGEALVDIDLPLPGRRDGKVRVSYDWADGQRLFVTTDRLSAFDRVLAGVPHKGQVLNQLSAWWFDRTADVVGSSRWRGCWRATAWFSGCGIKPSTTPVSSQTPAMSATEPFGLPPA